MGFVGAGQWLPDVNPGGYGAWTPFGWRNGDDSDQSFPRRLAGYREGDVYAPGAERARLGCTILREATFWPERRWLPWDALAWHRDHVFLG